MLPVYFPFTYVSIPVADALAACFKRVVVYQPQQRSLAAEMQARVDSGRLSVRVNDCGDDTILAAAIKDYRAWADLQQGGRDDGLALLKARAGTTPFFSDVSSSQIIADIKQGLKPENREAVSDSFFAARLFLALAQDFDRQQQAIDIDIDQTEKSVRELMIQLKAEGDPGGAGRLQDAGGRIGHSMDYMLADRLTAWIHLYLSNIEDTALYVTHSAAMVDELLENVPDAREVFRSRIVPASPDQSDMPVQWQKTLITHLADVAAGSAAISPLKIENMPTASGAAAGTMLTIFMVPGQAPHDFWSRLVGKSFPLEHLAPPKTRFKNTLIGLLTL